MKQNFFMLLAAVLLSSASAFAQNGNNESQMGDVNGDGRVDIVDVTTVIDIYLNTVPDAPQTTTYYFYVGTTKPTSLSQASIVESYPAEQTFTNPSTTEKCYVYVLTNADKTVNFYDPSEPNIPSTKLEDITTVSGYKITYPSAGENTWRLGKGASIIIRIS